MEQVLITHPLNTAYYAVHHNGASWVQTEYPTTPEALAVLTSIVSTPGTYDATLYLNTETLAAAYTSVSPTVSFESSQGGHHTTDLSTVSDSGTPEATSIAKAYIFEDFCIPVSAFGIIHVDNKMRLDANSKHREGHWRMPIVPSPNSEYSFDTNPAERYPLESDDVVVRFAASSILVFEQGKTAPYYTFEIPHDPFPFWSSFIEIPEQVRASMGRLDPQDIDLVVVPYTMYPGTGDTDVHALLSLWELGKTVGIFNSAPPVRSWRCRAYNKIPVDDYIPENPTLRATYQEAVYNDKVKKLVENLVAKVGLDV